MQMRFFSIPVNDDGQAADDLNRFLQAHRVLSVDRHFVQDGSNSAWAVCVGYVEGDGRPPPMKRGKVDYREVLDESDFAVFAKLRSLRKTLAQTEGVPPYALFTNEQLAAMVTHRVMSETELKEIDGVGDARVKKYGEAFLGILNEEIPKLVTDSGSEKHDETQGDPA